MIKIEKLFRREDKDMSKKGKKDYSDFSNVRRMQNELIPEEFPEGGFGSSIKKEESVEGKSTPWKEGQFRQSAIVYPDTEHHEDLSRKISDAHTIHDEQVDVSSEEQR